MEQFGILSFLLVMLFGIFWGFVTCIICTRINGHTVTHLYGGHGAGARAAMLKGAVLSLWRDH